MSELWIIEYTAHQDDYGTVYPTLMAVCTSEPKATELASGLWGHKGPGLPEDVQITKITADELIPDDDS